MWALIGFHILVVALSVGISLSLPMIAGNLLANWVRIENEGVFLVSIELIVAIVLIMLFNQLRLSIRDRRLARVAISAGLVSFTPNRSLHVKRSLRTVKERYETGKSLMVIGSTGHETFADSGSAFRTVLQKCLWANILLLNPYSGEASLRVQALSRPDFTLDHFREEGRKTVELLKKLKASGKDVKLKFYSDPPLVKLVILGDYLWLQHYHTSLEVNTMPEYVFKHNLMDRGFYTLFYQYFMRRWESPSIPEYDLDTDELVYRDVIGSETKRVSFGPETAGLQSGTNSDLFQLRTGSSDIVNTITVNEITGLSSDTDSRRPPSRSQNHSRIVTPRIAGFTRSSPPPLSST
ncbi:MAG: hypothetical protein K2Q17_18795 [Nitrospiraceae bacterium]|jgi:hypothetical protein|nr:hypothetical protein [Nitrospiraceae bacterium]